MLLTDINDLQINLQFNAVGLLPVVLESLQTLGFV